MPIPIGEQRSENHQRILNLRHNLAGRITSQQQFAATLEAGQRKRPEIPLKNHLLQLSFDVALFHR